jgi:sugar-specific transcriptional regulator TrmB
MLSDFGLSANQAKIFLATVQIGLGSVKQISIASKVAREEVYRTLPDLEKIGLVERSLGKPLRFRAIPAEEALNILISHEEEKSYKKVSLLKVKKEELLKNWGPVSREKVVEKGSEFILISEKDAILRESTFMINRAKKSIDIVSSNERLAKFVFDYSDVLREAQKRNVRIRIITELPNDSHIVPIALEKHAPGNVFELRYANELPSHFMNIDNSEALVATSTEAPTYENSALWTNNNSLVQLINGSFEELFRNSIKWTDVNFSKLEKTKRFVGQLQPAEHAIFIYDSIDAKHEILFNHIQNALRKNEAAVYVCSEESTDQIKEAMRAFGINVDEYEKTGALCVPYYSDFYIIKGEFNISRTLNNWQILYDKAMKNGFKGLRVTGETACFFKHGLVKELIEYEKELHKPIDIPIVVICAYNLSLINETENPINIYMELVKAHGTLLFEGIEKQLYRIKMKE